jgi:hypothetical protein
MPELDFFGPQTLSRVDVGDVSVRGLGIAAGIVDIVAATMLTTCLRRKNCVQHLDFGSVSEARGENTVSAPKYILARGW